MTRIAFVDSWYQAATLGSGTAVAIGGLGEALQALGHTVERVAPPASLRPDWPLTARRLWWNLWNRRLLQQGGYDLVVGFDIDGSGFALRPTAPYVCSIKGVIAEELRHEGGRVRLLFQLLALIEGWNARRAARVLTTSDYCRRVVHQHYGVPIQRIGLVPEGIDLARWDNALRQAAPRTDARPTVLCVARQYPRKHVADLISAAARLVRWLPDVRVRIVGDGPEHPRLAAQVAALGLSSTVELLQNVSYGTLVDAYSTCDVFCLPTHQEGFGIVFLEAMAAAKPIVSTTATAMPELISHGMTGILVAPSDLAALAGALLLLLTDDDRRRAYGAAGRQRVEGYTWQHSAARFLSEVSPLLASSLSE